MCDLLQKLRFDPGYWHLQQKLRFDPGYNKNPFSTPISVSL